MRRVDSSLKPGDLLICNKSDCPYSKKILVIQKQDTASLDWTRYDVLELRKMRIMYEYDVKNYDLINTHEHNQLMGDEL